MTSDDLKKAIVALLASSPSSWDSEGLQTGRGTMPKSLLNLKNWKEDGKKVQRPGTSFGVNPTFVPRGPTLIQKSDEWGMNDSISDLTNGSEWSAYKVYAAVTLPCNARVYFNVVAETAAVVATDPNDLAILAIAFHKG